MNTKKLVIFFVIAIFLILGGVWLGVALTKKNSKATQIIQFEVIAEQDSQSQNVLLFANQKNNIIGTKFLTSATQKIFEKVDVRGRQTTEALAEFAQKSAQIFDDNQSQNKYILRLSFWGENAENLLKQKNVSEQKIAKKMQKHQTFFQIETKIDASTSNLQKKFDEIVKLLGAQNIDFETSSQNQIIDKIFVESTKND